MSLHFITTYQKCIFLKEKIAHISMKKFVQNKIWQGYEYETVHILFKIRAKRYIDIDMNHNSGYSGLCELEGN